MTPLPAIFVVLSVLVACRSPLSSPRVQPEATRFAALAEREYAASAILDYRAPFENVREQVHARAYELYARACRLGHARSCWRVMFSVRFFDKEVLPRLGEHCLAGDDASCVSISTRQWFSFVAGLDVPAARSLCERGLGRACFVVASDPDSTGLREWLERGCNLGDAESCFDLHGLNGSRPDDPVLGRAHAMASIECKRGIWASCERLSKDQAALRSMARASMTRWCKLGVAPVCFQLLELGEVWAGMTLCSSEGRGCRETARLHRRAGARELARNAYEHGCQLGDDCLSLARWYRDSGHEAVPGRGKRLKEWLCSDSIVCGLLGDERKPTSNEEAP